MVEKDIQINGTSLISPRWNLQYIPEGIPGKRGDNVTIPYADGERFIKKNFEARTETLNMWVLPFDEMGKVPREENTGRPLISEQLEVNIEILKVLFGFAGSATLRKKMMDGTWRKATVEVTNAIQFERKTETANHRIFSVELRFPDPYFYGETQKVEITTPTSMEFTWIHNHPGTGVAKKMTIELAGGMENPKLKNKTTGAWLQINQAIDAGSTIIIDTDKFTVLDKLGSNFIHTISHGGDPIWMTTNPGDNEMELTCDTTPGGTVTIKYYPNYL